MNERILIVDDDPAFNAVLTRAFTRRGLDAHGALSAAEALAAARIIRRRASSSTSTSAALPASP